MIQTSPCRDDCDYGRRFRILREEVRHRCRCPFILGPHCHSPRIDIPIEWITWIDILALHFLIKAVAVVGTATVSVAVLVVVTGAVAGAVTGVNACITPCGVKAFESSS
jgi:hypothetical protein